MNYCINSITNVIHYKSMPLLEHEIDQLVNNLTMEQVIGLYEVQSFRSKMIEKISALQITEEERELMKRVQEMKRENLLYESIANSLNPTLLLTGGGNNSKQLAFMTILTIARTAVEYKTASNEADIEELQAMWKYRKEDLENFAELRKDALELVYKLFQKYKLNENDRLTENTSSTFSKIIAIDNARTRIRRLLDERPTFASMADYYYYLGMAYVDDGNYGQGKNYLDKYLALYQKAPIFRYDEKTGCIALTKLAKETNLTNDEVNYLVKIAIDNLPNNGPAIIQCALVLNEIGEKERAFNLLRSGIDNEQVSDKDALVMLATELLPEIMHYPSSAEQMTAAIRHCESLNINSFIPFLIKSSQGVFWDEISNIVHINDGETIFCDSRYKVDISSISVQKEKHKDGNVKVSPCSVTYSNAISIKDIQRKFNFLKNEPEQVYIFFEPVGGNMFRVKRDLDLQKVKEGDYPGMSRPYISARDRNKLVKYCKKKSSEQSDFISLVFRTCNKGKSATASVSYADYLAKGSKVGIIDYTEYDSNYSANSEDPCRIKTKNNAYRVIPPLRNYPKDIVRIILPGIDTVQICFSKAQGYYSLYSVTIGNHEYFKEPYQTISPEKKAGWFKRFLKKRTEAGARDTKEIAREKFEDDADMVSSSKSGIGDLWKKVFKKKSGETTDTSAIEEADEEPSQEKENESISKNWLRKAWDTICFWKK